MEKSLFISLLRQYQRTRADQVATIKSLRKSAPYSQVLAVLAARLARDHEAADQQTLLQSAAIVVTDRAVLKEIMLSTYQAPPEGIAVVRTPPSDIANEVIRDLKKLKQLKQRFETLYSEFPKGAPEGADVDIPPRKPTARHKKRTDDPLIEEIKAKKKLGPVSEKQKEQLEVIDQFIKKKPSIRPRKPKSSMPVEPEPAPELPEDFNDGVISETLVEILIKQDKRDKAIEVLKKLIWKFPQKKTYFAARIEELRSI